MNSVPSSPLVFLFLHHRRRRRDHYHFSLTPYYILFSFFFNGGYQYELVSWLEYMNVVGRGINKHGTVVTLE